MSDNIERVNVDEQGDVLYRDEPGKLAENGEVEKFPFLKLIWDDKNKIAVIDPNFNKEAFPTWDFVMAVLEMAKDTAKFNRDMARMNAMQMQAQRQMEANAIAAQVKGKGRLIR